MTGELAINEPSRAPHLGRALLAVHYLDLASYAYSQGRGLANLTDAIEQCRRCQAALMAEAARVGLMNHGRERENRETA